MLVSAMDELKKLENLFNDVNNRLKVALEATKTREEAQRIENIWLAFNAYEGLEEWYEQNDMSYPSYYVRG